MSNSYQVQKEVTRNGCFEGEISLAETKRLDELLLGSEFDRKGRKIAVSFEFSRNEYGIPMIMGSLETSLELECQRCLKALELPLQLDFKLMIDASDEIISNSDMDTIYSKDGYIDIIELVEDELMLAIPLVATHDDTACNEDWKAGQAESEANARENPFAVLQQLKTTD
ncbi:MAG: DUF177 domain-containing protein [Gammaproteobacteria bacterium]|nr:DUF177 domain-containing protein [Gammaproteobacteria bacterium]